MNSEVTIAKAALLKEKWALRKQKASMGLPNNINIGALPVFPLAKAVKMPKEIGFKIGSLAARLTKLSVYSSNHFLAEIEEIVISDNTIKIQLSFPASQLAGEHTLEGTQVWLSGIDGAGTGLAFDEKGRVQHLAKDDINKNPAWIASANVQRTKLNNSGENGKTLLDTYTTHRSAFNDVMTKPEGYVFQMNWGTDAIKSMAEHTNNCVNDGSKTINSADIKYGDNTYNENAVLQQLSLLTTLSGMSGACDSNDQPNSNSPYQQAAAAVASFQLSVLSNTNANELNKVPEKNATEIYSLVKSGTPTQLVSVEQVHKLLNGETISGKHADGRDWQLTLNDEEKSFVKDMQLQQRLHLERIAAVKPVILSKGKVNAQLGTFSMQAEFQLDEQGQVTSVQSHLKLDDFDLELDSNYWPSEVKALAQEELAKATFINSLLNDYIIYVLERRLIPGIIKNLQESLTEC